MILQEVTWPSVIEKGIVLRIDTFNVATDTSNYNFTKVKLQFDVPVATLKVFILHCTHDNLKKHSTPCDVMWCYVWIIPWYRHRRPTISKGVIVAWTANLTVLCTNFCLHHRWKFQMWVILKYRVGLVINSFGSKTGILISNKHQFYICTNKFPQINFMVLRPEYSGELGQYHGCWCPGSLHHQVISSHGIYSVGSTGPCFPWG